MNKMMSGKQFRSLSVAERSNLTGTAEAYIVLLEKTLIQDPNEDLNLNTVYDYFEEIATLTRRFPQLTTEPIIRDGYPVWKDLLTPQLHAQNAFGVTLNQLKTVKEAINDFKKVDDDFPELNARKLTKTILNGEPFFFVTTLPFIEFVINLLIQYTLYIKAAVADDSQRLPIIDEQLNKLAGIGIIILYERYKIKMGQISK